MLTTLSPLAAAALTFFALLVAYAGVAISGELRALTKRYIVPAVITFVLVVVCGSGALIYHGIERLTYLAACAGAIGAIVSWTALWSLVTRAR